MKLLLISPPRRHQVWAGVPKMFNDRFAYLFPPLAVMTLSSYLKRETKHTIDVMDCQPTDLGWDDIAGRVRDTQPDVVGVTAPATHCLVDVRKTIEAVRRANPNAFVVLGGPHVNAYPEQSARFPGVDVAMQGDGEVPLARLLDTLEGGGDLASVPNILIKREDGSVFQSDCVPNIEDLDSLPFADREACPPGLYYTPGMKAARTTTMMSSRGCPLRCTFCNVPHSYRKRSPEHVVEEIVECVERYGIEDIHFVDDFFNLTVDRVMQISEEILRRGVKVGWSFKATVRQTSREMIRLAQRAGCYRIHYGVETLTDEGLKTLNKKLKADEVKGVFRMTQEEGVMAIAYMIIGCPHEKTKPQIMQVHDYLMDIAPNYVVYSLFTPYPDAPAFQDGVDAGLWPADCWEKFMLDPRENHGLPTAWEEHLSKAELLQVFKEINRKFYFHPKTLFRTALNLSTFSELRRVVRGGISLIKLESLKVDEQLI